MDVLASEVKLPAHLDRLTDPRLDLRRVEGITRVGEASLLVVLSGPGQDGLFRLDLDEGVLRAVGKFDEVGGIWPCDFYGVLLRAEEAIWRVALDGSKGKLLDLPDGVVSLDAVWGQDGFMVCALVDRNETPDAEAPWFYPVPRKSITLCCYTSTRGWQDLAQVPEGCSRLHLSREGRRMVWMEPVNIVPEEAGRGEFFGFDRTTGKVRQLTVDAGQVGRVRIASDGASLLYLANHQLERPITTHMDLWWMTWDGSELVNLTGGDRCIRDFGWGPDENTVWISAVEGLTLKTEVLALDGTPEGSFGELDASSNLVWLANGQAVFETESIDDFPAIWTGSRRVPLPQSAGYEDFHVREVAWQATDGVSIEGVLYEAEGIGTEIPLLVLAHGGPASPVRNFRSEASRHRHLLRAGYRIFCPAFRGSLGFGDAFAQANIGCQGHEDLDDILTGLDYLMETGLDFEHRVGIFGGSYGGYMTLRALAMTDRFQAGVSLFGFIDNRRMTLETGDFTYETEYLGPLSWPITEAARNSDVFPHLGKIRTPLLLLHGDQDPICPLSESMVTCRALEDQDVPVGLVVYPGEGHGFRAPAHRQDCARRMLAWFLTHLPPGL
ncbi:MAG: prolyl oligopeptidase family serine peptidase [bacterium]|nr:prolyl oligopeptidase family serine peptidase [bacterium]